MDAVGPYAATRREFLKILGGLLASILVPIPARSSKLEPSLGFYRKKKAMFWERLPSGDVHCLLCPRECIVEDGKRGFCRTRENIKGTYYTFTYGNPCAVHIDPIEKKPFFHVLPGSFAFSVAVAGCNLRCKFCQNWRISQVTVSETYNYDLPPEMVPKLLKSYNVFTVTSTYTEPTVFIEYGLDIAERVKDLGFLYTEHSNGFINEKPLLSLCEYLDAACIDLKGFSEDYYREMSNAWLSPVLRTLETLKKNGVWVEVVNLVVPTKNDSDTMIRNMAKWIRDHLGPETPLHFSRFFPLYKLKNLPPTPVETLEKAIDISMAEGLKFVYIGNVPGHKRESTFCPSCGALLIKRRGYLIEKNVIKDGKCPYCGEKIPGIWS